MAAHVAGWLLTNELRIWPGRRVSLGHIFREGQPWRFPLECPALGMAVLVEGDPGSHEMGFALSYGEDQQQILAPLILDLDCPREQSWLFLERGPRELPGPGVYYVDISLDGEIVEEEQFTLDDMENSPLV